MGTRCGGTLFIQCFGVSGRNRLISDIKANLICKPGQAMSGEASSKRKAEPTDCMGFLNVTGNVFIGVCESNS